MLTSLPLLLLLLSPQGPPPPPPPPPMPRPPRDMVPERKGTSAIKGFVYAPDGRPLRRAQIRVGGSELNQTRTASTGLDGEYEVPDLPSGRYTVSVTRSAYLPLSYGQRRYGEAGMPIELGDKQVLEKVNFTLERAGIVSGRVLDEAGDGVGGAYVWVMQSQFFRGKRRFVPINPTHGQTDDTGQYRLSSIPPGEYVVQASFRETWMSDGKEPQMLAYAPSYFPSTANPLEAARVKIGPGQEVHAIDVVLVPGRAATLSGTVLSSEGAPLAGATVSLTQETRGPAGSMMSMAGSARTGSDAKFTLPNVSPGEYTIRASGALPEGGSQTALLGVVVSGDDLEGLVLSADAGAYIGGQIVTDTGKPLPSTNLRVSTVPLVQEVSSAGPQPTAGKDDGLAGGDGNFLRRTASGEQFLRVNALPRGWAVARVESAGQEFTDRPIPLRPNERLNGVTVVISNTLPDVSGKVDGENGEAAGTVLLFPVDQTRWYEAGGSIRSTRPDQAGTYRFDNVRAGEYFAIAVEFVQQWQVHDPEYLATLRDRAAKVVVGREPVAVDLKVTR